MASTRIWYSGVDNYRKHTLEFNDIGNTFTTELLDVGDRNISNIHEAFYLHLDGANFPIEVLYSGGLDSECVLVSLLEQQIPVVAVTLRLLINNAPINLSDLYYSEKFCRNYQVKHNIIDFHVDKFYNNGDHLSYMTPYRFTRLPVASLMWLLEKCVSFPIIGGDYTWPQTNIDRKIYSPHRHDYNCYDLYMKDKGITGIGNMLSHSLASNTIFIKEHQHVKLQEPADKINLLNNLGFKLEPRHLSYGWESVFTPNRWFNWIEIIDDLVNRFGRTTSVIKWNNHLAKLIDGEPGENSDFVI